MEIYGPEFFKNLNFLNIQELIVKHNYTLTAYLEVKDNNYEIILLLVKRTSDQVPIDLLTSYKNDLILKNVDKNIILKWLPYQRILQIIVKNFTHYSCEQKLKFNLMEYFLEYLSLTDETLGEDIIKRANDLARIFKEEALFANNFYQRNILKQQQNNSIIYQKQIICQRYGGKCCLDGGCDYLTTDIEDFSVQYIKDLLAKGMASIKAVFLLDDEKNKINIILILKARNIKRGKIDLISIDTECSHLSSNGCMFPYEKRPGFARHLIPNNLFYCFNDLNFDLENNKWRKYQSILEEVLYLETGLTKEEEFSLEIEEFFYNVLIGNFADATENSIKEAKYLLHYLKTFYLGEYAKANEKANNQKLIRK